MYKYIALSIIFVCISYVGFCVKKIYKNKCYFFKELENFLTYLLNEIKNTKSSLFNIIDNYLKLYDNQFTNFLSNYKNIIEDFNNDKNIKNILPKNIFWSKEEKNFLISIFDNIGKYDYDSEINSINSKLLEVKFFQNKANDDYTKKGELYFKLSLMLSLAIVLIAI